MDLKSFGANLKKAREKKNISAYELSLRISKDTSYINKAEKGQVNITLKVIFQICEILEIEPKILLD